MRNGLINKELVRTPKTLFLLGTLPLVIEILKTMDITLLFSSSLI
jgi:hypothetical protein